MSIRRDPIYISSEVGRWLWLLAKSETPKVAVTEGPFRTRDLIPTADSIADRILRQAILERHPQLAEHQKEIEKQEKQLIEKLQERTNEQDNRNQ